ncbi:hypothetical protein Mithridates_00049 [Acinetobacter phage Mithridates]|nr:hypothetical protein Mithridates_00049 [Acinetobacter phage Mithridates]
MKPEEFIRKYGVSKVRDIIKGAPNGFTHIDIYEGIKYFLYCRGESHEGDQNTIAFDPITRKETVGGFVQKGMNEFGGWYIKISDLKRLVESVDLVNSLGGLKAARSEAHKDCFVYNQPLLAAIAAYESIYGGGDD